MNHRVAIFVILANLLALAMLSLVYPHLMISPGPLMAAHGKLNTDCFACHAAFRGVTAQKCADCHKLPDIGRVTSAGQPISDRKIHVPFHQKLSRKDCIACHSDHRGVTAYRPAGRFSHELLDPSTRDRCEDCHRKPADSLHDKVAGKCLQCHRQDRWKPASFAHEEYFVLDRDHDVTCATCHAGNDFKRYGCYGCHEHSPGRVLAQHDEQRYGNLDDCVECHRSADGEGGERD